MNDKMDKFVTEILTQVARDGIDKVYTKKNFKEIYKKYCG